MKTDMWAGPKDGRHGCYTRLVVGKKRFAHATYVVADGLLDALAKAHEDDKRDQNT